MLRHKGQAALAAAAMMMCAVAPASAREVVLYEGGVQPGTIVIKTAERRLYLVVGNGTAIRYPVAAGRASSGRAPPRSAASMSSRPGHRLPKSERITRSCRM